jgi:hypothetical protein
MDVDGPAPDATPGTQSALPDRALIDAALDVVDDAGARAPREFLVAAALALAVLAAAFLVGAALADGSVRDLLLNLASEVIGAWITVVLIDGLWRRSEANADAMLGDLRRGLEARRTEPLSAAEREAWTVFVDEYQSRIRGRSAVAALRGFGGYTRELKRLEERGNTTLATYGRETALDR